MKISDSIMEVKLIYRLNNIEAAERFYEEVLKEFDMPASAGETPGNSRIKILRDNNVVTIITDKAFSAKFMKDFDD